MAKIEVYVKRDCVDSLGEFLAQKSVVEIDDKKDAKLFDLDLVEKYDEKIHKVEKDKNAEKIKALEEKAVTDAEKIKALEEKAVTDAEKIKVLEKMILESIGLAKDKEPAGYKEYIEAKGE